MQFLFVKTGVQLHWDVSVFIFGWQGSQPKEVAIQP
jgi:hypothetical protein